MRKLWLQNENGTIYSFNDPTKCIASNLQNLGIESSLSYYEYENSFQQATNRVAMTKPSMILNLMEGYKGYSDLINYIYQSQELKLYYEAYDTKYIYVDVASLTKGELAGTNHLQVQITFNKKSLWMKEYNVNINIDTGSGSKAYDYTYDYKYADVINDEISIENRGSVPAPVNFQITGRLENPLIQVFTDDRIVAQCRINIALDNATLIITSEEGKEAMQVVVDDVTQNVYQLQDFTMEGFIFAPVGASTIKIVPGSGSRYNYKLTFHELYRGN